MTKTAQEMALALVMKSSKSIIPVARDKKPLIRWQDYQAKYASEEEINTWFDQWPEANIAMVTGKISDVVVVDCDSEEANEFFLSEHPEANETCSVKTPRGYHYYFQYEEGVRNDAGKKIGPGIDIRGDGGYVLCPPSVSHDGNHYQFRNTIRPIQLPRALRDKLLRDVSGGPGGDDNRDGRGSSGGSSSTRIGQGGRNNALTRVAGALRRQGAEEETILTAIREMNETQCDPPLPDSEVVTIARSSMRYDPEVSPPPIVKKSHNLVTVRMDTVKREHVSWLWHFRIPRGRITLIEGDGGVCKSWLTMVVAAHATVGKPLPGGHHVPAGNVVIMSAEDSLGETIKGRLEDNGADMSKVLAIAGIRDEHGEKNVSLKDMDRIAMLVEEERPIMLVIDPVIAYLGDKDMNHAGSVRGLLAPLHKLAQDHEMAVVLVRHLNKSNDQKSIYRGQGSIDFFSACRSAFHVILDSQDRDKRHFVHTKSNNGPIQPNLQFSVTDGVFTWGDVGWESAEALYGKLNGNKNSSNNNSGRSDDRVTSAL
jgi:hypothetical protein